MSGRAAAIIPAAGSGSRLGASIPKQYLELAGRPILVHTVLPFTALPFISQIIVVVPADRVTETRTLLDHFIKNFSDITVVAGGLRRQDSVAAGLAAAYEDIDAILVHDGARPLVSAGLIKRCYSEIAAHGAAIAAVPVKDTLKQAHPDLFISKTVDRRSLWQAQTPQGARKELLLRAIELNGDRDVTDESSLLEQAGIPVTLVPGEETNIKITSPEDLKIAQAIMMQNASNLRIGHGFDAHRLVSNRKLVLGGIEIDHDRGLEGHSDADVLTHALCDAILGALGSGDLGRHFPDSDARYKDILSLKLLDSVVEQMFSKNYQLVNTDLTLVCQKPKLAPFLADMQASIATRCRCEPGRVNIKATTTEKMGYTGREEGISCHAVALLESTKPQETPNDY